MSNGLRKMKKRQEAEERLWMSVMDEMIKQAAGAHVYLLPPELSPKNPAMPPRLKLLTASVRLARYH